MDQVSTQLSPFHRLANWLGKLAIVADDDGLETHFLPPTAQQAATAAPLHSAPTRAA